MKIWYLLTIAVMWPITASNDENAWTVLQDGIFPCLNSILCMLTARYFCLSMCLSPTTCKGLERFYLLFGLLLVKNTARDGSACLQNSCSQKQNQAKKEKQYWNYIVIRFSSSPPPPKQDQCYLKPFLTEGNLSFPVVQHKTNRFWFCLE